MEDNTEVEPQGRTEDDKDKEPTVEELQDKLQYWKTHSRKNEAEAKRLREAAENWENYVSSQKPTETQLTEQLEAAQKELENVRRENTITRIASTHNIPAEAVKYIVGSDEEELETSAKELSELLASKQENRKPAPNPLQGKERVQPEAKGSALAQALKTQIRNH